MTRRIRALIIAEAANPEWASVPLVGWSLTAALAEVADVHLVTQIRNRDAVRRVGWTEDRDFTAIDSEALAAPLNGLFARLRGGNGGGWTVGTALGALSYAYFEHLVWRRFGRRIRAGEFDVVHRITPLSPTVPSPMAREFRGAGVPFVVGPLNGGLPWPRQFAQARRAEFEWLSYARDAYRLLPGYHSTRRNASAILIGSKATWGQMPRTYRHKCFYVPENGIDPSRFTLRRARQAQRPIRAVFLGRLVPYKGPDMLLEAAEPLLRAGDMVLEIIGDGPLGPALREFAEDRGLLDTVRFSGWLEHRQVQHRLAEADLLTFPSIREFGGAVVLEAMAVGVVPVVVDYGGPAELVSPATGFTIPIGPREQIVGSLRQVLRDLMARPEEIDSRARKAAQRARTCFTWEAKARQVASIYTQVLNRRDG